MTGVPAAPLDGLARVAAGFPDLELLLLYGSRARGTHHGASDWDFGYLGTDALDVPSLLARLVEELDTDRIDLVDLGRASGLLRYRAARDGVIVHEARDGVALAFRIEAVRFWCDAAPILERGYRHVLEELGP